MKPISSQFAIARRQEIQADHGIAPYPRAATEFDVHSLPLLQLIEIPFARKWTIVLCLLASLLAGWVLIRIIPKTYQSRADLLFMVGRESVGLDPTVTTGQTLLLQKNQEEDINSALQVLRSRQVIENVVDRLGADNVIQGKLPAQGEANENGNSEVFNLVKHTISGFVDTVLRSSGMREPISHRELATMRLMGSVEFDAPKKSTVVTVEATSRTPEMAQAIAQAIVDSFLELHVQTIQTKGSREFFLTQTQLANQRLVEAQEVRRRFMEQRRFVSIEAKRDIFKEQLSAIEMDLLAIQRDLEQALAKSKQLETDMISLEDTTLAGQQETSASTWGILRQRVYELELRELQESAKYSQEHPLMVATREELAGARKILDDFQSRHTDKSTVANPLKLRLQEELKLNDSQIAGLRSAIQERLQQRENVETAVAGLLNDENMLSQMDRDIDHYTSSLRLLREKEEEARVIEELRLGGISAVSQFQPATLVERPVRPNKKMLMASCVILGLVGGLGLAFLREANSGAIRSAEQAERTLNVPVLGQIGYRKKLGSDMARNPQNEASKDLVRVCRNILSGLRPELDPNQIPSGGMTLGVLGMQRGSGASTIAMALGLSSSEDFQLSTVLVEADRFDRTITKTFGLNGAPGLMELAEGTSPLADCIQEVETTSLRLVSSSSVYMNRQRNELNSKSIVDALHQLQQSTDLVIVDLPPAVDSDRLSGLTAHLDYLIVVLESGKTDSRIANRLIRGLHDANCKLIGVVLNKSRTFLPRAISKVLNAHA